jgi:hypothetical protein
MTINASGMSPKAPAGCQLVFMLDKLMMPHFLAMVPNGFPVAWDGKEWILPHPLTLQLITKAWADGKLRDNYEKTSQEGSLVSDEPKA